MVLCLAMLAYAQLCLDMVLCLAMLAYGQLCLAMVLWLPMLSYAWPCSYGCLCSAMLAYAQLCLAMLLWLPMLGYACLCLATLSYTWRWEDIMCWYPTAWGEQYHTPLLIITSKMPHRGQYLVHPLRQCVCVCCTLNACLKSNRLEVATSCAWCLFFHFLASMIVFSKRNTRRWCLVYATSTRSPWRSILPCSFMLPYVHTQHKDIIKGAPHTYIIKGAPQI